MAQVSVPRSRRWHCLLPLLRAQPDLRLRGFVLNVSGRRRLLRGRAERRASYYVSCQPMQQRLRFEVLCGDTRMVLRASSAGESKDPQSEQAPVAVIGHNNEGSPED